MLTAERIITARILKLSINPLAADSPYESDLNLNQFHHGQCYTVWYALGESISQRYNAVRMICTWHNPYEQ